MRSYGEEEMEKTLEAILIILNDILAISTPIFYAKNQFVRIFIAKNCKILNSFRLNWQYIIFQMRGQWSSSVELL